MSEPKPKPKGRGNLPDETSTFVGRDRELAELERLLAGGRLVTMTGAGGIGKTRTALRAAHRIGGRYRDGAWLVELSQLRDPMIIPHVVARSLDIQDQTTRPLIDVLADFLADRRCLLILDTCEHLVDGCALLAQTLLAAAPGLRILATSRRLLAATGEHTLTLTPLPVPEPYGAGDVREYDAVRLFTDRAREVDAEFAVTAENESAVSRLCRRLDGLPLALELAAPWLRALPVHAIADRLDDRFRLLAKDAGEGPDRHEALRTSIGWSHELCTPEERLLWARASAFAGSFDRRTAMEVCMGGPLEPAELLRVLGGLVQKSIIIEDGGGLVARYRMLDTVREYGQRWLRELGEERAVKRRHRDFYQDLARRAYARWMGPKQVAWYERMAADHPDLRVALESSLTDPVGGALEMAGNLWFFWYACGYQREGRRYLERALTAAQGPGARRTRAAWALGLIALSQGDLEAAEQCIAECHSDDDPVAAAAMTFLEGCELTLRGEHGQCLKALDGLELSPERGGMEQAIWMLERGVRAFAHVLLGELAAAAALAEEAREVSAARGERILQGWADYVQALAELGLGRPDPAAERARSAIANKRPLHDTWFMALAIDALALAEAARGEAGRAARLLGIGQRIWRSHGLPQLGAPELVAAREGCEIQARAALGDEEYDAAFAAGLHTDLDDGVAYALES